MARTQGALGRKTRRALHLAQSGNIDRIADGVSPVEYLLKVMRDSDKPEQLRIEAAKAVAPYMHPKLNNILQTIKSHSYIDNLLAIQELIIQDAG